MSTTHQQRPLTDDWRTLNVDTLDPDAPPNFDTSTLHPPLAAVSESEVRALGQRVRSLLRSGDAAGALRTALREPPYGADEAGRDVHLGTVVEVLQGIRAGEMVPLLKGLEGEEVDVLVKYLCVLSFFLDGVSLVTGSGYVLVSFALLQGWFCSAR
jgi:actin related protein 2/3 complex subunit 5